MTIIFSSGKVCEAFIKISLFEKIQWTMSIVPILSYFVLIPKVYSRFGDP